MFDSYQKGTKIFLSFLWSLPALVLWVWDKDTYRQDFRSFIILNRRCVSRPSSVLPLCLWGHLEVVVGRVALLLVPVLQLDTELVLASGCEGIQRCVPQPVLSLRPAKALPVFLPCRVEVQRAILPILDHCPPTACRLHVTFSLRHIKDVNTRQSLGTVRDVTGISKEEGSGGGLSVCLMRAVKLKYLQCRPVQVRLDGVDSTLFDPKLVNLCTVLRM